MMHNKQPYSILEKKIWEDNRTQKAFMRKKDGSSNIGYAGKSENKIKGNVWKYNVGGGHVTDDKIAYKHPAIFPDNLAADHIFSWSNEGDLVYDCFGGSGTTAKMAKKLNRNWILSELSEEYCQLAEKRYKNFISQLRMF